jgi:hypothetical protein
MKVSFTRKEYQRLLELVHLGLTVTAERSEDGATESDRYAEISAKVFELAEPFGCADLVTRDADGSLYAAEKLTEGVAREKMQRFVDDVFWSELVGRLAERDLRMELGATKLTETLTEEEEQRLAAIEDTYWREFETHGVDRLFLLRGGQG